MFMVFINIYVSLVSPGLRKRSFACRRMPELLVHTNNDKIQIITFDLFDLRPDSLATESERHFFDVLMTVISVPFAGVMINYKSARGEKKRSFVLVLLL